MEKEKKGAIICFDYKKLGYIRLKYLLIKNHYSQKKVMVTTWDDNDNDTSNEEQAREISNFALMALEGKSFDELDEVNKQPLYINYLKLFKNYMVV